MKKNDYWLQFSVISIHWHYLIACIYLFIGVSAIFANIMVLFYLLKVKSVKRPGTYFLINLAIADLFKVAINLPMNVVSSIYGEWVFGQIGCDIYGFSGGLFGFLCISTLAFMSIERYLIVKNPLFALKITKKGVFACIMITWIYSASWITPQLFSKDRFVLEGLLTSCSFDYINTDLYSRIFMMSLFIGGFLIPLLIIIVFYILLWLLLRKNSIFLNYNVRQPKSSRVSMDLSVYYKTKSCEIINHCVKNNTTPLSLQSTPKLNRNLFDKRLSSKSTLLSLENNDQNKSYKSFVRREIKVAKTIFLLVFMFCLAWLPYAMVALLAQFGTNREKYITPFSTSLPAIFAKTSSIYNPIIYTLSSKEFRTYIKSKILSLKGKNSEARYV